MGSHVDAVLEGVYCELCSVVVDGEAPGYPRICELCEVIDEEEKRR